MDFGLDSIMDTLMLAITEMLKTLFTDLLGSFFGGIGGGGGGGLLS